MHTNKKHICIKYLSYKLYNMLSFFSSLCFVFSNTKDTRYFKYRLEKLSQPAVDRLLQQLKCPINYNQLPNSNRSKPCLGAKLCFEYLLKGYLSFCIRFQLIKIPSLRCLIACSSKIKRFKDFSDLCC